METMKMIFSMQLQSLKPTRLPTHCGQVSN